MVPGFQRRGGSRNGVVERVNPNDPTNSDSSQSLTGCVSRGKSR
jgi:hypothetical protein